MIPRSDLRPFLKDYWAAVKRRPFMMLSALLAFVGMSIPVHTLLFFVTGHKPSRYIVVSFFVITTLLMWYEFSIFYFVWKGRGLRNGSRNPN